MTVTTTARSVTYVGNDATRIWPFAFRVLQKDDLVVTLIVGDVETTLAPSEFTVSALPATGGSVTYPLVGNLPTGTSIRIKRVVDLKQETQFDNQGGYFAKSIEAGLDRVTMAQQQLQDQIDSFPISGDVPTTAFSQDFLLSGSEGTALDKLGVSAFMQTALGDLTEEEARATLGFPAFNTIRPGPAGVDNADAIQAAFDATPGTTFMAAGTHTVRAGVLNIPEAMNELAGAGIDLTVISLFDFTVTNKSIIKYHNKSGLIIRDLTLNGNAEQTYMEGTLFTGPVQVPVVAGRQYRFSMRGDVGSSLAIVGQGLNTTLTWTDVISMNAGVVVSALLTPTTSGLVTMTKTGTVRQVSVVKNAGTLGWLLSTFNSQNVVLKRVKFVNFADLAWASNGCIDIELGDGCIIDRGAHSWEQNVGFLWTSTPGTTPTHGKVVVAGAAQCLNTGVQGVALGITVQDGFKVGSSGYGAAIGCFQGSDFTLGGAVYVPNQAYLDQDLTSIANGEHYGRGTITSFYSRGNPGVPLVIGGPITVLTVDVIDCGAYYKNLGNPNVAVVQYAYTTATVNSNGASIRGGGIGDTHTNPSDRVSSYGLGDQNGSVYGTDTANVLCYNNYTGRFLFNASATTDRRFRGVVRTAKSASYDPASLTVGTSTTPAQTMSAPGAKVGDAITAAEFSLSRQGVDLKAWVSATDTISFYFSNPAGNPAGTVNLGAGIVTASYAESPTA